MRWIALPLAIVAAGCGSAPPVLSPAPAPPDRVAQREPPATARDREPPSPRCARLATLARITPIASTGAGSTVILADHRGRRIAYVADEDERAVRTVDLDARAEIALTPLDAAPGQLLATTDGRLVVALRGAAAIVVLEPAEDPAAPLERRCTVAAPAEPFGLALTPDGARLLVTSRWGHALTAYATDTMEAAFSVALPRDPAGVVASSDGTRAFVSHVNGARLSVVDLAAPRARSIDLHQVERVPEFSAGKPVRWSAGQGYALVRTSGGRLFAPEILAHPDPVEGEVSSSGYGSAQAPTQIGDVAGLDEVTEHLGATPVLDFENQADCLLPRAAAVDEKAGRLLVACLGVDAILAYDAGAPLPHLAPQRRWKVASGPSGIAVDAVARRAVVWSQFARTVSLLSLDSAPSTGTMAAYPMRRTPMLEKHAPAPVYWQQATAFALPEHAASMDPKIALGRQLFHAAGDARIAGDGRACASCHPDGRDDGFTWSTPDGPRQTPILASRLADTAPYGWDGANVDLKAHVRRTLGRLFGFGLAPFESEALLAYVGHMAAPTAGAASSEATTRGEALFHSAETGCATCHVDARAVDGLRHDVQSRVKGDKSAGFDTPSLRFVGQSAPYFHDGRYATLADLLQGVDGTMGHTAQLAPEDRRALEAYLETL